MLYQIILILNQFYFSLERFCGPTFYCSTGNYWIQPGLHGNYFLANYFYCIIFRLCMSYERVVLRPYFYCFKFQYFSKKLFKNIKIKISISYSTRHQHMYKTSLLLYTICYYFNAEDFKHFFSLLLKRNKLLIHTTWSNFKVCPVIFLRNLKATLSHEWRWLSNNNLLSFFWK